MDERSTVVLEVVLLIILVVIILVAISALLGPQLVDLVEQIKLLFTP